MARTDEQRLALLVERLAILEASDEQTDLIHTVWDQADPAARRILHATGDTKLLRLVRKLEAHEASLPPGPGVDLDFEWTDAEKLLVLVAGKMRDVKAWVGTDKARAQAALEVEENFESPRPTLLTWLYAVADEG